MTITKLPLAYFINPKILAEAFDMQTPDQQVSAYKQSLLDTLRFMQGAAYNNFAYPNDKANSSFAMQKWIHNLDLIKKYFDSVDPTMSELITANQQKFIQAISQSVVFEPILWSRNLETPVEKLPPKFLQKTTVPAPQYRGASKFYGADAPLTDKIALDRK